MSEDKTPVELLFDEQTVDQEDAPDLAALGLLGDEPKGEVDEYEGKLEERVAAEEEAEDEPQQEAEEDAVAETDEDGVEEAEEEEAPEQSDDEAAPDERPQPTIPKARLDKEIQKRRDLESQLEEMKRMLQELKEQGLQKPETPEQPAEPEQPQVDYDAQILELEKQYMEKLFNGDTDDALQVRAEINKLQEEKLRQEIQQETKQTVSQTEVLKQFQQEAERLQNEYPIFNPDAPEFNQEALDYAVQLRDALVQTGKPLVDALREATELARLKYGYEPKAPEPEKAPEVPLKPKPKKESLEKKLEAAAKQPPKLSGDGEADGEVLPDPTKMSIEDWEKLPEEVQNKLLGIV